MKKFVPMNLKTQIKYKFSGNNYLKICDTGKLNNPKPIKEAKSVVKRLSKKRTISSDGFSYVLINIKRKNIMIYKVYLSVGKE